MAPAAPRLLDHNEFVVKEHVAVFKLHDTFDILDLEGRKIGHAEENISTLVRVLRLVLGKRLLPTSVEITDAAGHLVCRLARGISFFRSVVDVTDAAGTPLGFLRSKILTIGGGFWVHLPSGEQVAEVKGNWIGWEFEFLTPSGQQMGTISKKWAGALKEMFTSADTYLVRINPEFSKNRETKIMLLASALAIDTVFKEKE